MLIISIYFVKISIVLLVFTVGMSTIPKVIVAKYCGMTIALFVSVVGMSTIPEAIVAKYCGLKVFGLSLITNSCVMEYDSKVVANHAEVLETANKRAKDVQTLITNMVAEIPIWRECIVIVIFVQVFKAVFCWPICTDDNKASAPHGNIKLVANLFFSVGIFSAKRKFVQVGTCVNLGEF